MTDNKQYIGKSVNAIVIRDGKVLLAWRKSDGEYKLSLPGGPAVEGETPEETVAREVRQETGLSVHPITLAGMHFGPDWCAAFNCELLGGKLTGEAEYVDVDEALRRRDISELTRLFLAGRERALEKDVVYNMKNAGCSLYL